GSRVVLRYRLPEGSAPSQSDALGTLVALTPAVRVRTAGGDIVEVPPERVVVLKSIPPKPVRTSAIRNLERAVATAPGGEAEWVAGWVARRADAPGADPLDTAAATPLADASMSEGDYFHDLLGAQTLEALEDWYSARGLPLTLRLPDRLVRPPQDWSTSGEHTLLTAALPLGPAAPPDEPGAMHVSDEPEGPDEGSARLAEAPDGAVWAVLAAPRTAAPAEALATACRRAHAAGATDAVLAVPDASGDGTDRSEERRVGKERRERRTREDESRQA